MKAFTSHAQWPDKTTSTDQHETREQAQAVLSFLKQNGLGGDGKVFPVATWVTPDEKPKGKADFINARGNGK